MTFSHQQCRLPRGPGSLLSVWAMLLGTACSVGGHVCARVGGRPTPCTEVVGTWMVFIRPVLKHGPRSATCVRVLGVGKTCLAQ